MVAVVCSYTYGLDPSCTHDDLVQAFDSGADTIVLQDVGPHYVSEPIVVERPVTVLGNHASVGKAFEGDFVFELYPDAAGSVFEQIDPLAMAEGADASGWLTTNATSITVRDWVVEGLQGARPVFDVWLGGALVVEDTVVRNVAVAATAPISVVEGTLEIIGGQIGDNQGSGARAIWAVSATLDVKGGTVTDLEPPVYDQAGRRQVYASFSDLTIEDAVVSGQYAAPLLDQTNGSLQITRGIWSGPASNAVVADNVSPLTVTATRFSGFSDIALRFVGVPAVEIVGATFDGADAAVFADAVASVTVDDSWFCGLDAGSGPGVWLFSGCELGCSVTRSVFQSNHATAGGGAIRAEFGTVVVAGSTFLSNNAGHGSAISTSPYVDLSVDHSLFAYQTGAPEVVESLAEPALTLNGFYENQGSPSNFPVDATLNPVIESLVFANGPGRCGQSVDILAGSDPFLFDNGIGAGALCVPEIRGDGVDQDCDGFELCAIDGDGDGYAGPSFGSFAADLGLVDCDGPGRSTVLGDCDDADPTTHPGAQDPLHDCSGGEGKGDGDGRCVNCSVLVLSGGSCSAGVGAPEGGVALLLVLSAARRRATKHPLRRNPPDQRSTRLPQR